MSKWFLLDATNAVNMSNVSRVIFFQDGGAVLLFNSLERVDCAECRREGRDTGHLDQATYPIDDDMAVARLKAYINGTWDPDVVYNTGKRQGKVVD